MIRRAGLMSAMFIMPTVFAGPAAGADLDEYVKREDPAFTWSVAETQDTPAGAVTVLKLTSQKWQGIPWRHSLTVYDPKDKDFGIPILLFISGGSTDSTQKPDDHAQAFALARLCGARVAVLRGVPNQPLLGDKREDDLISETFLRYLDTKDKDWPLLFPMVKSAVAAMDALQAWGKTKDSEPNGFVVTGASKRGWTTWLTGAVDPRVLGIAPMVIPTLNFAKQNPHQLEVWGKYSEQIDDYVRKGLMEKLETPDGKRLTSMVDPFFYLDRITIPKLQINGTNDRYWTLDSVNLFWNDQVGPKAVCYLPNAGHGLEQNRDFALRGIAALFRHAVTDRPLPNLRLELLDDPMTGRPRVTIDLQPETRGPQAPKSAAIWSASSTTQDFREARWSIGRPSEIGPVAHGIGIVTERPNPDEWFAYFADITCAIDAMEYHLSTPIRIIPPRKGK